MLTQTAAVEGKEINCMLVFCLSPKNRFSMKDSMQSRGKNETVRMRIAGKEKVGQGCAQCLLFLTQIAANHEDSWRGCVSLS